MLLSYLEDTIVAMATAVGESGIGMVRLSGGRSCEIADVFVKCPKLIHCVQLESHRLQYAHVFDGDQCIDEIMVAVMRAPHSYTGEDVVEISCHGNPLILQKIISLAVGAGARLARPGEYTLRSFVNGKKDLVQAEAVADLIHSKSEEAVIRSVRQLDGDFSKRVKVLRDRIQELLLYLEAELDFAEEEIDFLNQDAFQESILTSLTELESLLGTYQRSSALRNGVSVVLAGRPNVGKSSLFNRLLKSHRAIVTDVPGTTRDVVDAWVTIKGIPFRFVDTAGVREGQDQVEKIGVMRTHDELDRADIICLVIDAHEWTDEDQELWDLIISRESLSKTFLVINKVDIADKSLIRRFEAQTDLKDSVFVSAETEEGLDSLEDALCRLSGGLTDSHQSSIFINERHQQLLQRIDTFLRSAQSMHLDHQQEMIVMDLRDACRAASDILGETFDEDILNQIFSNFCIGK